ncbi:MAG: hypothetical protein HY962_11340 [Ignavibacteriae bacterium]|nr:hypothetical protein [Ignavibacteriota bacterium]
MSVLFLALVTSGVMLTQMVFAAPPRLGFAANENEALTPCGRASTPLSETLCRGYALPSRLDKLGVTQGRSLAVPLSRSLAVPLSRSLAVPLSRSLAVPLSFSGCNTRITGEVIDYAGRFPGATDALLVRAIDSSKYIEWETEEVPAGWTGDTARFVMLAGFDTKPGGRLFRLSVNGAEVFHFRNPRDSSWTGFDTTAANGMRLVFHTLLIDVHGDAFGLLTLSMPRALLRAGAQNIAVRGEHANDRRWFMVFQMPLAEGLRVRTDECLLRSTDGSESQRLRAGIWHFGAPQPVVLSALDSNSVLLAEHRFVLRPGHTEIPLPVPPVDAPRKMVVRVGADAGTRVRADGRPPQRTSVGRLPVHASDGRPPHRTSDGRPPLHEVVHVIQPVRRYTVYLLPHSHVDIGYTDQQHRVEDIHWNNIEAAIDLAERTQNYPEGSRFVWNLETAWALWGYGHPQDRLRRSTPRIPDPRLKDALKKGWLHLDATYTNTNTSTNNAEELIDLFRPARAMSSQYNIPVTSMMQVDIPGAAWGVVTAAARSGIRYFVSAPNNSDRIGLVREAWEDKPFYWISQSGRDTLLYWQIQPYSLAYGLKGQRIRNRLWHDSVRAIAGEDPEKGFLDPYLFDHLATLSAKRYPYDMIALSWALSDNAAIDPDLPDAVRAWNERYASPRILISSTATACAVLEARYGAVLPHYSGDMTEYWTDGIGSGARETALKRGAVETLLQTETLRTMTGFEPAASSDEAWRFVALFSEHTWGAWNSTSEPDNEAVRQQWHTKRGFAETADSLARSFRDSTLSLARARIITGPQRHPYTNTRIADVYNTLDQTRKGLIILPPGYSRKTGTVMDSVHAIGHQVLADSSLALYSKGIPAFGVERFRFESYVLRGEVAYPKHVARAEKYELSNGILRIRLDSVTGNIASIIDLRTKREYVDSGSAAGMNAYFYLPGDSLARLLGSGSATITVKEKGPLRAALLVRSPAPGCHWLEREIRLAAEADFLEIENRLDKIAIREKEGVHFGFGFRIPGGTMRIDAPWATIIPEKDQLPGSCKNWLTVQRHVDISNDTMGVTWATLDAPLMEVGGITARLLGAQWQSPEWIRTLPPSQTLYSWALNNHWHTNFRADQEGELRFRYAIRPHGGYDAAAAMRFGIEQAQPFISTPLLIARPARENREPTPVQLRVHIDNPSVVLLRMGSLDQYPDAGPNPSDAASNAASAFLRLFNPTETTQKYVLQVRQPHQKTADEERTTLRTGVLGPYEHVTLLLE